MAAITGQELTALRGSLRALTRESPLPWKHSHPDGEGDPLDFGYLDAKGNPTVLFGERYEGAVSVEDENAAALVRLINAVPSLLDEIENERMEQLEEDDF